MADRKRTGESQGSSRQSGAPAESRADATPPRKSRGRTRAAAAAEGRVKGTQVVVDGDVNAAGSDGLPCRRRSAKAPSAGAADVVDRPAAGEPSARRRSRRQRVPGGVGEPLPSIGVLESLLPVLGRQLEDAVTRPGRQQNEHIAEVGPGLDLVQGAGGDERDDGRVPLGALVGADEEPVFRAPGEAWLRRKPCERAETSFETQRACNARPVEQTSSRKRVLRGPRATSAAKRRQRGSGPWD